MTAHVTPEPASQSHRVPGYSVGSIARLVRERPASLGGTRLILIDGPAGSGKTTLANRVAVALGGAPSAGSGASTLDRALAPDARVQILHADDMYEGWTGLDSLSDVLMDQVLTPLSQGTAGRFHMWDWHQQARTHAIDVPLREILIVEGVGVAMAPARSLATLTVWIEADAQERLRRGLARDGEQLRSEWLAWQRREQEEFAVQGTWAEADVLVDGNGPIPD